MKNHFINHHLSIQMSTNKLKIINDPVHGFIKIPYEILYDVEHRYFQRLRRISQTGLLSLVFFRELLIPDFIML